MRKVIEVMLGGAMHKLRFNLYTMELVCEHRQQSLTDVLGVFSAKGGNVDLNEQIKLVNLFVWCAIKAEADYNGQPTTTTLAQVSAWVGDLSAEKIKTLLEALIISIAPVGESPEGNSMTQAPK